MEHPTSNDCPVGGHSSFEDQGSRFEIRVPSHASQTSHTSHTSILTPLQCLVSIGSARGISRQSGNTVSGARWPARWVCRAEWAFRRTSFLSADRAVRATQSNPLGICKFVCEY